MADRRRGRTQQRRIARRARRTTLPNVLRAAIPAGGAEATDAKIFLTTPSPQSTFRLEAEGERSRRDPGAQTKLLEVRYAQEPLWLRVRLNGRFEEAASVDGGTSTTPLATFAPLLPNKWTRIALTIDLVTRTGTATFGNETLAFHLSTAWAPAVLEGRIGLIDANPSSEWEVLFDDALVAE
jgi:hypothetical protein